MSTKLMAIHSTTWTVVLHVIPSCYQYERNLRLIGMKPKNNIYEI